MKILEWFFRPKPLDTQALAEKYPDITFEMCFKLDTLEVSEIIDLVNNPNIGYILKRWIGYNDFSIEKANSVFSKMKKKRFFHYGHLLYDIENKHRLSISRVVPIISPALIRIIWNGSIENFNLSVFEHFFNHKGFVCAYSFWELDEFLQNETFVRNYEKKEIPIDKRKVLRIDGERRINIDGNPGRKRQVCNMMLRSCWRMWFGEQAYEMIKREKVEGFEEGIQNILLENGLRFIELYDNPFESNEPNNREIQQKFNETIDIESIYKYCLEHFGMRIPIGSTKAEWGQNWRAD
ncbi:hypothetical protein [Arcicella rosea]|uniref:Uncharacterized protein n=1 Tax=Arcicella rosea TaxID=502909 RepID=A0A841EU54_9BACT|nr:hypothetical protein [Arcicella rosea]MBB6004593.1 hypothetical protein [Arcicella rosea]